MLCRLPSKDVGATVIPAPTGGQWGHPVMRFTMGERPLAGCRSFCQCRAARKFLAPILGAQAGMRGFVLLMGRESLWGAINRPFLLMGVRAAGTLLYKRGV